MQAPGHARVITLPPLSPSSLRTRWWNFSGAERVRWYLSHLCVRNPGWIGLLRVQSHGPGMYLPPSSLCARPAFCRCGNPRVGTRKRSLDRHLLARVFVVCDGVGDTGARHGRLLRAPSPRHVPPRACVETSRWPVVPGISESVESRGVSCGFRWVSTGVFEPSSASMRTGDACYFGGSSGSGPPTPWGMIRGRRRLWNRYTWGGL